MGKLKNVKITFDDVQPYLPGALVKGVAAYNFPCTTKVEHVKLFFDGQCKVKWKVSSDDDEKTYKSHEVYFSHFVCLHGGNHSNQGTTIAQGAYRSPFQFRLPDTLPSSFSAKHGNVFYTVRLEASYPGIFAESEEFCESFQVTNPINIYAGTIATQFAFKQTRIAAEDVDAGCCGFNSGTLTFAICTDKSAYEPGESVIISGYLINGSSRSTDEVTLTLYQNLIFYGRRSDFSFTSSGNLKSKAKKYTVAVWSGEKVRPNTTATYTNRRTISVPNVPESDMKNCQNIDVKYTIKFKVMLSGMTGLLLSSGHYPIFIGNGHSVPPSSGFTLTPTAPEVTSQPESVDVSTNALSSPPPAYLDVVPPSYDQAVFLKPVEVPEDQPREQDSDRTAAQGTYYDWSQSAFTYT